MGCEAFDVVVVPFPNAATGQGVLAMITSAKRAGWLLDVLIEDLRAAGLPSASLVRMKVFTLDQQLILRKAGQLVAKDRRAVNQCGVPVGGCGLPREAA